MFILCPFESRYKDLRFRQQAILLALVLGPFLYQRINLVLSLQANAPGKIQSRSAFSSYEVKFKDQLRNCEDVVLPEGLDGLAFLSCDEGRDRWNTVMVSLFLSLPYPGIRIPLQ